jgi:hypothetical protein
MNFVKEEQFGKLVSLEFKNYEFTTEKVPVQLLPLPNPASLIPL